MPKHTLAHKDEARASEGPQAPYAEEGKQRTCSKCEEGIALLRKENQLGVCSLHRIIDMQAPSNSNDKRPNQLNSRTPCSAASKNPNRKSATNIRSPPPPPLPPVSAVRAIQLPHDAAPVGCGSTVRT
jgi:hypothetical protein